MDNYIKLCAEMAYNDSLMESYFEEENLLEVDNKEGFKEKVKKFFEGIKNFIKNLFNKVITFVIDTIGKVKAKFAKHENASLYNDLMEMVITEGYDYASALMKFYADETADLLKAQGDVDDLASKVSLDLGQMCKDVPADVSQNEAKNILDKMEKKTEEFTSKASLLVIKSSDRNIRTRYEKIFTDDDKYTKEDTKLSSSILSSLEKSLHIQKQNLEKSIKKIDQLEKEYLATYQEKYNATTDDNPLAWADARVFSNYRDIAREYSKSLSVLERGYVEMIKIIVSNL